MTYSESDVAAIGNADARAVLMDAGLPDGTIMPFGPASAIEVWTRDSEFAVLGLWGGQIPVLVHRLGGGVHSAPPWSDEIDPVNASVRAFGDSLRALHGARPLSKARFDSNLAAGQHAEALLRAIDPATYEDPCSFWQAIVSDIKNGDFA